MRIRIHEIETGAANPEKTADLLSSLLGLPLKLQQASLTVLDSGITGLDFNISNHLAEGAVRISFLTDDMQSLIQHLNDRHITYEGPYESHLAMLAVRFKMLNGIEIVVNTATDSSPDWLKFE